MSFLFGTSAVSASSATSKEKSEKSVGAVKDDSVKTPDVKPKESEGATASKVMRWLSGTGLSFLQNKAGHSRLKKPVKVQTSEKFVLTGSSNTLYNTVQALTAASGADASALSALFDQMKVESVDIWVRVEWSNAPVAGTAWCLGFSPSTNTALTAVRHSLLMSESSGPVGAGLTLNPSPTGQGTPNGFLHFRAKVPGGTALNPSVSSELVGGSWFATTDASAICGYLTPVIEAGGSTTPTMTVFVRYNCLARYRT
jgi:hypothetical protein